jgi:HPt (histidine-containing phosphotransfer) domain-containing protein
VADRTTAPARSAVLRVQWTPDACSSTVNAPHDPALERPEAWHLVLDAACLQRLHDLDPGAKAGLVARVLRTYVQSLAKLLDQLASARASADAAALRHVAHTLKSSSASVGALALSELCAEVERQLRDGAAPPASQIDAMVREGERVLAALRPTTD